MKTIQVYLFEELTKDIQEQLLRKYENVNVDYDWWQYVYDDAENVGIEINRFDIYYRNINISINNYQETAEKILEEHGEECGTHKIASAFLPEYLTLKNMLSNNPDSQHIQERLEELERTFQRNLGRAYLTMLKDEYDYQTSEEAIRNTIIASEFYFTESGVRV